MNKSITIPTMTAAELRQRLHDIGMPMSHKTMCSMIEQGAFPFAQVFHVSGSQKRRFLIYTTQFEAWAKERAAE